MRAEARSSSCFEDRDRGRAPTGRESDGAIGGSDGRAIMSAMQARHLRAFLAVLECGGIAAAAQQLGFAQSSVSDQLRGLEQELGVAVLHRTSTGTTLTPAGERLAPLAREWLEL